MPISVAGTSPAVVYSPRLSPSRISVAFAEHCKPLSRFRHENVVPLSVTETTREGCFTGVLDFVVDHLCEQEVVLGKDWLDACASNGVSSSAPELPEYRGDLSLLRLPDRFAPSMQVDGMHPEKFDDTYNNNIAYTSKSETSRHSQNSTSSSSTFGYPLSNTIDSKQGFEWLEKVLLGDSQSGVAASLFNLNVIHDSERLAHLVSIHGMSSHTLSIEDCRVVLLRHLFSGQCVSRQCSSLDRTACALFSKGFQSPSEMSRAAFSIMASAKACQRSTEDLLHVFQALEIPTVFQPRNVRRQISTEMHRQAKTFLSMQDLLRGSGSFFLAFERHTRATLLAIASAHGVNAERYTGTIEQLKDCIISHFATAACYENRQQLSEDILPGSSSSLPDGCRNTLTSVETESTVTSQTEYLLLWLKQQLRTMTRLPLQRLLGTLGVKYDAAANLQQLRSDLRKFMTTLKRRVAVLKNSEHVQAEIAALQAQLEKIREDWPSLVPQSLKNRILSMFREQTSSEALQTVTCAACAEACLRSTSSQLNVHDIDIDLLSRPDRRVQQNSASTIVDPTWLDPDVIPPQWPTPMQSFPDIALDPAGVQISENSEVVLLTLCKPCKSSLTHGHVPPLSLANHMLLGDIPPELKGLTIIEEAMIAKCRAKCWIVQLKEDQSDSVSPNCQRGVKGHVIVYPQRPSAVAKILPPPINEISTPICVIFVGSSPPSNEWLRNNAKPLAVRREKVRDALIWLKDHNFLYKDIVINHDLLNTLPDDYILPVHVEHILPNSTRDSLTSRYDKIDTTVNSPNDTTSHDQSVPFQNVVITDIEGTAPANELRAAAVRHVKSKGGGYVQVSHDPTPVNEFFNPELFPMIYPTLFPYGIGGFENSKRTSPVSLKRHTKHLFSLADRRFQEHYSFLFTIFNILQRRELLLHTSLKVKKKSFDTVAKSFASVSQETVHIVSERVARGDWQTSHSREEQHVLSLMKEVNVITSHVPGSAAARVAMRNEIRALIMDKGLPSFYLTINPADIYNPLVKFLAGAEIDIDRLLPEQIPEYWQQSILVAKNPVVAAQFFDIYMRSFISALLGYDPKKKNLDGGIFGLVNAYYGCVEAQGRGTLHCHMLIWVEGGLNPNEIKERVTKEKDSEFCTRLLTFLDDTISNSIPPPIHHEDPIKKLPHPCSIRGINPELLQESDDETEMLRRKLTRQQDLHRLVQQCQTHVHSQTCYKYWKGPLSGEPRECRFDLDEKNTCPKSFIDPETGEITLRCLDGMVNNFNSTIIEAVRCNMDIKFIGSGAFAKAVLYYITDYITKTQLKAHVAFAALELAIKKLGEYNADEDEVTIRAKKLLQKCAYAMISHQELSAQQVCSYLLDFGDHYTSHKFRNLYWTSFERFIDANDENRSAHAETSLENIEMCNEEDNNENDTHVDNDPDIESLHSDDEVVITVEQGQLIAKTDQVLNYQQRSSSLNDLCLWDMTAQVDKVPRKKKKSAKHTNDDMENDTESFDDIDEDTDCDQEELENNECSDETSASRNILDKQKKITFKSGHPEYNTHRLKARQVKDRLVPVPIGPSIPRRDREQLRERYCKLMLIFFKPWRSACDLHKKDEPWSTAFEDFMQICSPQNKKIMDNMQILHECKDSRDDHFIHRRNHNRTQTSRTPGQTLQQEADADDFGGDNNSEEEILQHLMSIDDCRSTTVDNTHQEVLSCLQHAEDGGLFSSSSNNNTADVSMEGLEQVSDVGINLEDIWKSEYENRRLQWKKKECVTTPNSRPQQSQNTNENQTLAIIKDCKAFETNSSSQITQPSVQQDIPATDPERTVHVQELIDKYTLNREQARAFKIVAEHSVQQKPTPLRMCLAGPGGTGKSRVINALKEFFECRNQSRRFRLASYTGVAARNISGMTLHAALLLNQRNAKGMSEKTRRDLIAMWQGVDYLFVDEVSMIGCRLLLKISEALNDAKESQLPFGGMNVVFAGDFAQLPPVGDSRLFAHISTQDIKSKQGHQNIFGKLLWLSISTVVVLSEIMRQHGTENKQLISLLSRLREGKCTHEDFLLLNSRQLTNLSISTNEDWHDVPIIVSNNECKDALNVRATTDFATRTGRPLHWYYATDTRAGKMIEDNRLDQYLEHVHSGKTNQRLKKIPMVIGMPVMICQNFDVEHGVVNGCTGTLKKIRYLVDKNGHRHATSCIINAPSTSGTPLTGVDENSVVVLQDTTDIRFTHPYSHKSCNIKRTQVPVLPAFAMTAHKAQGQTLEKVIVDLESCRGTESPYVMISRIKTLNGLRTLRPFKETRIQCRQSEDSRREFRRLEYLRLLTITKVGEAWEKEETQIALSNTKYKDKLFSDSAETNNTRVDSARRLEHLQQVNYHLTQAPCPVLPLPHEDLPKEPVSMEIDTKSRMTKRLHYLDPRTNKSPSRRLSTITASRCCIAYAEKKEIIAGKLTKEKGD